MKKIIISAKGSEKRAALLNRAEIEEFYVERISHSEEIGDIFLGKVDKVITGLEAAFIELGLEKNGFLKKEQTKRYLATKATDDSIRQMVQEGQYTYVQIMKESHGTKGPKVTENIELPGAHLVYMPFGNYIAVSKKIVSSPEQSRLRMFAERQLAKNEGILFRTSASAVSEAALKRELLELRAQWEEIVQKSKDKKAPRKLYQTKTFYAPLLRYDILSTVDEIIVDTQQLVKEMKEKAPGLTCTFYQGKEDMFAHYHLEEEAQKLRSRHVWLANGATLTIDHTEAFTIIDVNSTKFTGKATKEQTMLKVNEMAAKEIVKQIRKRNIGGIIIIDFLNMTSAADRNHIIEVMKKECQADHHYTQIYGFTSLGLLEMTRKKDKLTIAELYEEPCRHCQGKGRALSSESLFYQLERELLQYSSTLEEAIWIEAPHELAEYIKEAALTNTLETAIEKKVYITSNINLQTYQIRQLGTKKEIEARIAESALN